MATSVKEQTNVESKTIGWQQQTFLVGEQVYLRTFVPGDEKNATSWRASIFPKSPELVEKWIKEELPEEGKHNRGHLAIVRKTDDVVVGSIAFYYGRVSVSLTPYVDSLYGEIGQHWLAEAVILAAEWQGLERHKPTINMILAGNLTVALEIVQARGFEESARWREMIEINGTRHDKVMLAWLHPSWVERIGHPLATDAPRTGNGTARPRPAQAAPDGDVPKQAVLIGPRVYLRPQDKEDAKQYVEGSRLETETFFDIGRHLNHLASWEALISSGVDDDLPKNLWFEVCLRDGDTPIGSVGIMDIDYVNRTAETGSHFYTKDHRGQGYGWEAKHLLLEYTFNVLGMHMVNSFVYYPNTRSAAALRKQGYREAGSTVWLYPFEGGFGNMLTFDLLADEWRALPREGE